MKKFKDVLNEVAPAGWEGTVKAMKKEKNIDNPWALAWYMKNKGYTSKEARQAIKSGFWPQGYKTTDLALERKKARAEKAERIGKVVDVLTVEEAPANSTANVAFRSGGLKAGNKGRHVLLTRNALSAKLWLLNGGPKKWEVLNLTKEEFDVVTEMNVQGEGIGLRRRLKKLLPKAIKTFKKMKPDDVEKLVPLLPKEIQQDVLKGIGLWKDLQHLVAGNEKNEDAPANSTAGVAMRDTPLFRKKKTSEAVDKDAAKELQLYIENDQKLYRQVESIVKNIQRKMKSGKYDHKKAPKLWMYVVDAGAKQYHKEHGTPGDKWTKMFDKQTRQAVAETMADEYRDEIEAQGGKMF